MRIICHRDDDRARAGFTVVELLVSIVIIGILTALLLPAIQRARSAARRTECANHLRNVALALLSATESADRFPASGNFGQDPETGLTRNHHSWVVDILPWIDQRSIADQWDKDKPIDDPVNQPLAEKHLPVLTCPGDISVTGRGDLSYVVNGGVGFTVQYGDGTHDCPVDRTRTRLDLNGNGIVCVPPGIAEGVPSDKDLFLWMGLFFNETWKWDVTRRHHRVSGVIDGMSQTFLATENVRTGANPESVDDSWASPYPLLTSFYIGNPCVGGSCRTGKVRYTLCNAGLARINAGLVAAEGTSPYPSSFHEGGVNVVFCDGHLQFLSESIDGRVYAALVSPAGSRLQHTALEQIVPGSESD